MMTYVKHDGAVTFLTLIHEMQMLDVTDALSAAGSTSGLQAETSREEPVRAAH